MASFLFIVGKFAGANRLYLLQNQKQINLLDIPVLQ